MNHSMRAGGSIGVLVLAALLVGFVPQAGAWAPAGQNQTYEIPLPAFDTEGYQSPARAAGSLQVASALSARYGGAWQVQSWNPQSGTPRWVYGHSVRVADGVRDAATAERLARQVVSANQDVLRADASQLRLIATPNALGKWAVHFQQTWHGMDVLGATVRVLFTEDGRLMLMGSDYQPIHDLSPIAVVSESQAVGIARDAVPFHPATDRVEPGVDLLVLPVPTSASEVVYHLVWRVRVHTEDPLGTWVTHVDAHSGKILWRYNDIDFFYGGTTLAPTEHFGYCDGTFNLTIPYLNISVGGVGNTVSDAQGNWSINGTGGNRTVTSQLKGTYVDVNNRGGARAAFSGTAQENVPLPVVFNDANAQKDERDVFQAITDIHKFFETFAPGFHYTNTMISAYVSTNATCNAYWDGTINFYKEGGGCANTGRMQQVVYHEFGHGIQNELVGGQGGQGLGEGNGDIDGNLITQDPIIGRGFYLNQCTSGIRNSLNTLRYPGDVIGQEIHYAGQVIAGFNWDEMVLFQQQFGDSVGTYMSAYRWHYGRALMRPQTQPDQVLATFIADDDNGSLDDGTPHYDIICQAATNHGFSCPPILVGVFVYHDAHPYSGSLTGYDIVAKAVSLPAGQGHIVPGSVITHYKVNGGGFSTVPMSPTGNQDEYSGRIPGQPYGSVIQYYITASNDLGSNGASPPDAPNTLHYFEVNNNFFDDVELVKPWKIGAQDDNATTGIWIQADPVASYSDAGVIVQPEDDHTPDPGHICFITGNANPGDPGGTNDVDGGKTTLFSPRFDLTDATQIQVSYWRWYSDDQGSHPGQDYWDVSVTNDGGQTWIPIEHTTDSPHVWTQIAFDLGQYVADPGVVQFRFVAQDNHQTIVEAGVDDFQLSATFPTAGVDGPSGVQVANGVGPITPNPFGAATEIRFALAQAGPATLSVYDAAGRRVATLARGQQTAGSHRLRWNGTDELGRSIPAGTYFCRLTAAGQVYSSRMVLVR